MCYFYVVRNAYANLQPPRQYVCHWMYLGPYIHAEHTLYADVMCLCTCACVQAACEGIHSCCCESFSV